MRIHLRKILESGRHVRFERDNEDTMYLNMVVRPDSEETNRLILAGIKELKDAFNALLDVME